MTKEFIQQLRDERQRVVDDREKLFERIVAIDTLLEFYEDDPRTFNDNDVVKAQYVNSSDGDNEYLVKVFRDGTKECQCKGFVFRGYCRHIEEVR